MLAFDKNLEYSAGWYLRISSEFQFGLLLSCVCDILVWVRAVDRLNIAHSEKQWTGLSFLTRLFLAHEMEWDWIAGNAIDALKIQHGSRILYSLKMWNARHHLKIEHFWKFSGLRQSLLIWTQHFTMNIYPDCGMDQWELPVLC